jgi:hypothetical protein
LYQKHIPPGSRDLVQCQQHQLPGINCTRGIAMPRRLIALVALLLIGSLGVGLRIALLAQPPATIEDAVAATLDRTGAPTAGLRIEEARCVPARETCLSYIADVVLPDEHDVGRLACVGPWRGCTLTLAEFGLRGAPVPDVGLPNPWVARLDALVQQAVRWARGLIAA